MVPLVKYIIIKKSYAVLALLSFVVEAVAVGVLIKPKLRTYTCNFTA